MRTLVSRLGRSAREALVHVDRWWQPGRRPRICFLPWGVPGGDSTELRVYNIARVLRDHGWRCVVLPAQLSLAQRRRVIRQERPDLLFLQKARHPANRPGLYGGYPVVFDIDDADFLDERQAGPVTECCRESRAVIAGSHFVADWCSQFNPNVHVVWTGTPAPRSRSPVPSRQRGSIVAWAPSSARQVADQEIVAHALAGLARREGGLEFRCYGVECPDAIAILERRLAGTSIGVTTYPRMPYPRFLQSLREVAVGLAPFSLDIPFNQGKSFGKVLAYLVSDVAVVASPVVEHPRFFRHGENGMLPRSPDEWANSVAQLLDDPNLRQSVTDCAWANFTAELTTEVAASRVARIIQGVLA